MHCQSANDARFLSLNPFPKSLSTVKHQARVVFNKQLPRNEKLLYNGITMSDSLYRAELRDKIRPKAKGGLQFGQSSLDRYGVSLNIEKVEQSHNTRLNP